MLTIFPTVAGLPKMEYDRLVPVPAVEPSLLQRNGQPIVIGPHQPDAPLPGINEARPISQELTIEHPDANEWKLDHNALTARLKIANYEHMPDTRAQYRRWMQGDEDQPPLLGLAAIFGTGQQGSNCLRSLLFISGLAGLQHVYKSGVLWIVFQYWSMVNNRFFTYVGKPFREDLPRYLCVFYDYCFVDGDMRISTDSGAASRNQAKRARLNVQSCDAFLKSEEDPEKLDLEAFATTHSFVELLYVVHHLLANDPLFSQHSLVLPKSQLSKYLKTEIKRNIELLFITAGFTWMPVRHLVDIWSSGCRATSDAPPQGQVTSKTKVAFPKRNLIVQHKLKFPAHRTGDINVRARLPSLYTHMMFSPVRPLIHSMTPRGLESGFTAMIYLSEQLCFVLGGTAVTELRRAMHKVMGIGRSRLFVEAWLRPDARIPSERQVDVSVQDSPLPVDVLCDGELLKQLQDEKTCNPSHLRVHPDDTRKVLKYLLRRHEAGYPLDATGSSIDVVRYRYSYYIGKVKPQYFPPLCLYPGMTCSETSLEQMTDHRFNFLIESAGLLPNYIAKTPTEVCAEESRVRVQILEVKDVAPPPAGHRWSPLVVNSEKQATHYYRLTNPVDPALSFEAFQSLKNLAMTRRCDRKYFEEHREKAIETAVTGFAVIYRLEKDYLHALSRFIYSKWRDEVDPVKELRAAAVRMRLATSKLFTQLMVYLSTDVLKSMGLAKLSVHESRVGLLQATRGETPPDQWYGALFCNDDFAKRFARHVTGDVKVVSTEAEREALFHYVRLCLQQKAPPAAIPGGTYHSALCSLDGKMQASPHSRGRSLKRLCHDHLNGFVLRIWLATVTYREQVLPRLIVPMSPGRELIGSTEYEFRDTLSTLYMNIQYEMRRFLGDKKNGLTFVERLLQIDPRHYVLDQQQRRVCRMMLQIPDADWASPGFLRVVEELGREAGATVGGDNSDSSSGGSSSMEQKMTAIVNRFAGELQYRLTCGRLDSAFLSEKLQQISGELGPVPVTKVYECAQRAFELVEPRQSSLRVIRNFIKKGAESDSSPLYSMFKALKRFGGVYYD